jgi:hypothetical protein
MSAQQTPVEVRGQFDDFGRVKWVPVEQAQEQAQASADDVADVDLTVNAGESSYDGSDVPPLTNTQQSTDVSALQRQIAELTQTVNILTQAQLKGMQQEPQAPTAPTPPDPTQFDLYDPQQFAEFQRLNNAYIQASVRHEVNAAMAPHGQTLQDARLNLEYNQTLAAHGQDSNFKANMESALKLVARQPNKFSIPEAYDLVASIQPATLPRQPAAPSQGAKPARTITAQEAAQKAEQAKRLPASNGVSGTAEPTLPPVLRNVGALGRIMLHNQQSGRARPIGN